MDSEDIYVIKELDKYVSITEYLKSQELHYRYQILENKIVEANRWIARQLQIPLATKVFSFKKLRIVNDLPKSIDHVYLEYSRVPGIEQLDLSDVSFYAVLKEHFNLQVTRNEEELAIVMPTKEEAELLQLRENEEVLTTKGHTYTSSIQPLEYFEITAVTSFYRFRSVSSI